MREKITTWWLRSRFNVKNRIEFYETLILLLDNRVMLNEALSEIFHIHSHEGKHPTRIQAMVAQECLLGVSDGKPISEILARWVSHDESSLIEAGEQAGKLQSAFKKAILIIEAKQKISQALATATIYPSLLMVLASYLLKTISTDLVPKLAQATEVQTWDLSAQILKLIADFINYFGGVTLLLVMGLIIGSIVSLPYLKGNIRFYLDKLPPWSIYRLLYGSTFLLNIGVLLDSGVKLNEALQLMAKRANPWLRERITAALYGVNIGANLGQALYNAGYDFPDKRAVQYLRIISSHSGAEENIERFGLRWMEESLKKIKTLASLSLILSIAFNGLLMLLVIAGTSGMTGAMMSNING
jgi:type II secretory pathway component PulF